MRQKDAQQSQLDQRQRRVRQQEVHPVVEGDLPFEEQQVLGEMEQHEAAQHQAGNGHYGFSAYGSEDDSFYEGNVHFVKPPGFRSD
jgi:hypothetical protein